VEYAARYNKKLTEEAKQVFGDIVEKVYTTTWASSKKTALEALDKLQQRLEYGGGHEFGGTDVEFWIKFTNGKVVSVSCSEWGYIGPADVSNYEEI